MRWVHRTMEIPDDRTQPLAGRAGWYGKELDQSGAWIRALTDATARKSTPRSPGKRAACRCSVLAATNSRSPPPRRCWPRSATNSRTGWARCACAACRWSATPTTNPPDLLGYRPPPRHRGVSERPRRNHGRGARRDEAPDKTYNQAKPGKVVSSRARARSTGPLRWHTDRCDVIALLCVRNAKAGGISKLTSIVTIYNEILRRRPDLLALLCQDYWRARPGDEDGIAPRGPSRCRCSACRTAS